MFALLIPLISSLISGAFQPIKDYFSYKSQTATLNQQLELAKITAEKDAIVSGNAAAMDMLRTRLNSTSSAFKQNTFWLLCIPLMLSILFPKVASTMWHNFDSIPHWFQWIFIAVYSSIWGLPIARGGYGTIVDLLNNKTERQVIKIKALNEKAMADSLRNSVFKNTLTQDQWNAIVDAAKAGENAAVESDGN